MNPVTAGQTVFFIPAKEEATTTTSSALPLYQGIQTASTPISNIGSIPSADIAAKVDEKSVKVLTPNQVKTFSPPESSWSQGLDNYNAFLCPYYVKNSLFFPGTVDRQRFIKAMKETLDTFHFLYGKLHVDGPAISIGYTPSSGPITLEIETKESSMKAASNLETLPQFDPSIQAFSKGVEGVSVIGFKLTEFQDGFVIGCRFSHLMDESSMNYFFRCLSQKYEGKPDLKAPVLFDIESLPEKSMTPIVTTTLEEFRTIGKELGRVYASKQVAPTTQKKEERQVIELRFSEKKLKEMRESSSSVISSNDIINAVLLRIHAQNPAFSNEDTHAFSFPCNMRKRCDLGDEAIGNVLYTCLTKGLVTGKLRSSTVTELAQMNRKKVEQDVNKENYLQAASWLFNFKTFSENPTDYQPSLLGAFCTSNWATFNYDEISFNGKSPVKLSCPSSAPRGSSVITFDCFKGEKEFITTFAIPNNNEVRQLVAKLAKENNDLFTWEIVFSGAC